MLKRLLIRNYAIIDEIQVDFSDNLNIITGETGAGKSILVGALSLILGNRADTSVLFDREKKCYVEGVFSTNYKSVRQFLKENDLDIDVELVIRREITSNGKSRAFVNDSPVNLDQLRQLSSTMVDLHQQFDTLELGDREFQQQVLDALANHGNELEQYQIHYRDLVNTKKQLKQLKEQKDQFNRDFDYNKFLFDELDEAGFTENELEECDSEIKLLSNSEGIKQVLSALTFELNQGDKPIARQLKALLNQLQSSIHFHPALPPLFERLYSAQIELQDVAEEFDKISGSIAYDPQRIEELNERASIGYRLLKKHGVHTTKELLQVKDVLQKKLEAVLNIEEAISGKEEHVAGLSAKCETLAAVISENRMKQVNPLEAKVNSLLEKMGMPNARLKVKMEEIEMNISGKDSVEFLFDTNNSNRFEPLRKIASGGELSRLMLCIKSLIAQKVDLPTLIFDEIDTGISGEAGNQVGIILKDLGKSRQVICITHQPQIAGKADAHYFVYKEKKEGAIKTRIKLLSRDERITAIAKMLSGEKPTGAAIENAREIVM